MSEVIEGDGYESISSGETSFADVSEPDVRSILRAEVERSTNGIVSSSEEPASVDDSTTLSAEQTQQVVGEIKRLQRVESAATRVTTESLLSHADTLAYTAGDIDAALDVITEEVGLDHPSAKAWLEQIPPYMQAQAQEYLSNYEADMRYDAMQVAQEKVLDELHESEQALQRQFADVQEIGQALAKDADPALLKHAGVIVANLINQHGLPQDRDGIEALMGGAMRVAKLERKADLSNQERLAFREAAGTQFLDRSGNPLPFEPTQPSAEQYEDAFFGGEGETIEQWREDFRAAAGRPNLSYEP